MKLFTHFLCQTAEQSLLKHGKSDNQNYTYR